MQQQDIPLPEEQAIQLEQNTSFHPVLAYFSYQMTIVNQETTTILPETNIFEQEYDLLRQAYDILPQDQDVILLQQAALLHKCDTIDQAIKRLEAASECVGRILR